MRATGHDCSVCGAPATAEWHASGAIAVCQTCAAEILPALAADGVNLGAYTEADMQQARDSVMDRYDRAIAKRLRREGRR